MWLSRQCRAAEALATLQKVVKRSRNALGEAALLGIWISFFIIEYTLALLRPALPGVLTTFACVSLSLSHCDIRPVRRRPPESCVDDVHMGPRYSFVYVYVYVSVVRVGE